MGKCFFIKKIILAGIKRKPAGANHGWPTQMGCEGKATVLFLISGNLSDKKEEIITLQYQEEMSPGKYPFCPHILLYDIFF